LRANTIWKSGKLAQADIAVGVEVRFTVRVEDGNVIGAEVGSAGGIEVRIAVSVGIAVGAEMGPTGGAEIGFVIGELAVADSKNQKREKAIRKLDL
jgi:uncharacterized membrane protein